MKLIMIYDTCVIRNQKIEKMLPDDSALIYYSKKYLKYKKVHYSLKSIILYVSSIIKSRNLLVVKIKIKIKFVQRLKTTNL